MNYVLDEARLQDHHDTNFPESSVFALRHEFARNGFIKVRNIVDDDLREKITREVNSLIDRQLERRDLHGIDRWWEDQHVEAAKSLT